MFLAIENLRKKRPGVIRTRSGLVGENALALEINQIIADRLACSKDQACGPAPLTLHLSGRIRAVEETFLKEGLGS